jgi:hypothetical protein
LALGIVLVISILIGVVIGRAGSVKTPVGEVTIEQSSPTMVTVRVSVPHGLRYTEQSVPQRRARRASTAL